MLAMGLKNKTSTLDHHSSDVNRVEAITRGLLQNYQIGKVIGQGAYATVKICMDKNDK